MRKMTRCERRCYTCYLALGIFVWMNVLATAYFRQVNDNQKFLHDTYHKFSDDLRMLTVRYENHEHNYGTGHPIVIQKRWHEKNKI